MTTGENASRLAQNPAGSGKTESTHRLWGGAFGAGTASEMDALNRSIGVDFRLWPHDIALSRAWAAALRRANVITAADLHTLLQGLDRVHDRLTAGVTPIDSDEDIHTLIDRLLHEEAGEPASRLHTGRSRNDQVATATRLWVMDAITGINAHIADLQRVIVKQAEQLEHAILPAYTHLQRAQPVLGAHWLLSHFWPLSRDMERLEYFRDAASTMPLGSGAIAGSAFPIDREQLRVDLRFKRLSQNSIDAVGDRDFIADLIYAVTMLSVHISRLAEDLILYGTSEFGFLKFGHSYTTGSSMMPQKRNPDALEIARGSPGRALGALTSMLVTLKGLPGGYSKDLQDDKRALFDAVDSILVLLPAVRGTLAEITFDQERMRGAVSSTMMATDLADYLVRKGISFRDAHAAVGRMVRLADERGVEMTKLSLADYQSAHPAFDEDVYKALSPEESVRMRSVAGGTASGAVRDQLQQASTTAALAATPAVPPAN